MKALIIYDDFATTVKANAALQHSARYSDVTVQWNITFWRVDMLKCQLSAETALTEARDTHLIVFVGRCAQSPPSWLGHWLEHWAKCRQVEDAALAVYCEGGSDTLSLPTTLELPQFAMRHGLKVIFDDRLEIVSSQVEDTLSFIEGDLTAHETVRLAETQSDPYDRSMHPHDPRQGRSCSRCSSCLQCSRSVPCD